MVDLVGIEPTTSSMPWKKHTSRRLILKRLATGISGDISGQFPAKNFNNVKQPSCMGGGSCKSRTQKFKNSMRYLVSLRIQKNHEHYIRLDDRNALTGLQRNPPQPQLTIRD